MIKVKLKNPIGKTVKINGGFIRIPCEVFLDSKDLQKTEKNLKINCVEYEVLKQSEPKKVVVIAEEKIDVKDNVEPEKVKKESNNKKATKTTKSNRSRKSNKDKQKNK